MPSDAEIEAGAIALLEHGDTLTAAGLSPLKDFGKSMLEAMDAGQRAWTLGRVRAVLEAAERVRAGQAG